MATIQENKETIIKSFNSIKTDLANLESNVTENYVDVPTFTPVAKAAYQEYPSWQQETKYTCGDMICVTNRQGTILNARCIKNFTSAKDVSNNNTGWETDVQLGNIQITPILNSTVGGPAWALMKGYTLDAWEIENFLNNAYTKMGDLDSLQTNSKDTLVNAINEIKNSAGSGESSNSLEGIGSFPGTNGNKPSIYIGNAPTAIGNGSSNLLIMNDINAQDYAGTNTIFIGDQGSINQYSGNFSNAIICGSHCSGQDTDQNDGSGIKFIIGNGNYDDAFKVSETGNVYALGSVNSNGADYAECFEWLDGNIDNEDRKRMFVSLNKDKIQIAKSDNEYIIGIISTKPSIIGNNIDSRSAKKEWGIVGLLGQLEVKDDGNCVPGEMCSVENGIAVPGNKYYVMERLDNNLIKVLFK